MNKAKLKTYAPQARRDFIAAVTARAHSLGLSDAGGRVEVAPAERQGDVALIGGQAWPVRVLRQRDKLVQRMRRDGFGQTLEAVAYTWFNRFAALRYMEIHDYLGHGQRVLSNREGGLPEMLAASVDLARRGDLPTLDVTKVEEMKLAGNQDGELYRLLLVAQCNALSTTVPFLFERIDDETELLLPDNLLRTDSVITGLVEAIAEEDWAEVEIIGWLYQFYISEKKDEVIGNVVKSEDIPAATQLFTPNWIVQYLVQNSVGRLWCMANPASSLKSQWPYYIEPAEQTPEVNAALAALTQARMDEDGGSLNPESITVLDPACGSGHILVEAYEALKVIYLERGYRLRDIPRLILEKNLYGLDIDDRAAQMAGFALLMKARADDRRLLNDPIRLNVASLQESKGLELDEFASHLAPFGIKGASLKQLLDTFENAKTFGSLIQIPPELTSELPAMLEGMQKAIKTGDLYAKEAAKDLLPLVGQARALVMQFDAVVANPPYMGSKYYQSKLKEFINKYYPNAKADLYTCFIERDALFAKPGGLSGMVTIPNWMFLSSFEDFRNSLLLNQTICTLIHNGRGVFGSDFGSCSFVIMNAPLLSYFGTYRRLFDKQGSVSANADLEKRFHVAKNYLANSINFENVPGKPIAYNLPCAALLCFSKNPQLHSIGDFRKGMNTGNNEKYLRHWTEVNYDTLSFALLTSEDKKWYPIQKGGAARRWYGNHDYVVNWRNNGEDLRKSPNSVLRNQGYYFREGVTWTTLSSARFNMRYNPCGFVFEGKGSAAFFESDERLYKTLGLCNSSVFNYLFSVISPTIDSESGSVGKIPFSSLISDEVVTIAKEAISIAKEDWDCFETSWGFVINPVVKCRKNSLQAAYDQESFANQRRIIRLKDLEEINNCLLIEAYGLNDELSPEVPEDQITLTRADREKDCQRLISYAMGCMMGRYSLDEPGLIYAQAGNVGFDSNRYKTFPADADGIVPITDEFWFEDDAAHRVHEFLLAVWRPETLADNLAWLAENLGMKGDETPDETIRRYLADKFYKDHLQTYKKRPIYWLFSSGKQGAFQALVYLHRYHEGTLARLRAEYVVPLTGKIQGRIAMLEKDRDAAPSAAARTRLGKQIETMKKQYIELLAYDEKLRHYADMRITLDLDDGVKVNYGKFGDLLAEVKAVTGGAADD